MFEFTTASLKTNAGKIFFAVIFAFLCLVLFAQPKTASAAMCIYNNTDSLPVGDFNNAINWTNCGGNAPGVGDTVILISGTSTQLTADRAISSINSSGTIDARTFGLNVTSTVYLSNGGVVTSTSGYLGFGGTVTIGGPGSNALGSSSGNINVSSTFTISNVTSKLDIGSGTSTFYGTFIIDTSATINGRTGTLEMQGGSMQITAATFNMQTAKLVFTGGSVTTLNYFAVNPTSFSTVVLDKSAGYVALSGNGTSTGSFTIVRGAFNLGANTFRVGGDFIVNSGGTFTPGTGTIDLNGSGAQSVSSTAFNILTVNKSAGTVTLTANGSTTGAFSVLGGTFDAQSYNFTAGGAATINNSGVVTSTSGNLGFGGSLTISGTSALGTLSGNINVSSSFTFQGSILDMGSGTSTFYGDSLIFAAATINGRTGTLEFQNNTTIGVATLNMQTAKTVFTGGNSHGLTYSGANPTSFSSVEVNKSAGTVTLSGNGTSTGNLTLYNGGFSLGSNTFRVGGNFTVNGGAFTPGTGTIELNGSGAQGVSSTGFYNLTIAKADNGNTASLVGNTTTTNNFSLTSGIFSLGSREFAVGGNFIVTGSGIFTPGTGTVNFNGSGEQSVSSTGFATTTVSGTGIVTLTTNTTSTGAFTISSGIFDMRAYTLFAGNNFIMNGGTFTPGTGTVNFNGTGAQAVSSTGFATTTISGTGNTVMLTANTTSTGPFTISTGTFGLGSYTLSAGNNFTVNGGTFTPGTGTVKFNSSGAQTASSTAFYNLSIAKSGGALSLSGNTTSTNNFSLGGGTLSLGSNTFDVGGSLTLDSGTLTLGTNAFRVGGNFTVSGGTFTPGTATTTLNGSGAQSVSSTGFYDLVVNNAGGTATFSNNSTISRTLLLSNGGLNLGSGTTTFTADGIPLQLWGGTFSPGTGTVEYRGTQTVASTTFYNLSITPTIAAKTATLNASTTALGAVTVNAIGYLVVGANNFTVLGAINNTGLITESTGSIIHTAESVKITDSSGTEVSSLSNTGSVYVTVQDANRNLNGAAVETFTVPVSFNAAAGSDAETLTLTETSVSSGIFRNASAIALVSSSAKTLGNSQFELLASGIGTANYTDSQHTADTASDAVTLTYVAPTVATVSGGGGGGGGGGPAPSPTTQATTTTAGPVTAIDTAALQKLQSAGFAVHQLVKLPDDGDPATQEDSAVYYLGADGRRHAFPNDKAYKTWFCDFSGVQTITSADLAAISLGRNITYKSGRKMVKFTTDPKVYAIEKGGILRWIKIEQLAIDYYGVTWNKQIDDINDAFYTNYIFGQAIEKVSDFNPANAEKSVTYPSDSMGIQGYKESAAASSVLSCPIPDADKDGLTDDEETVLGTDLNMTDTDGDGLTDGDEIKKYFTNPLSKDTDGDGYEDGLEVATGHDPSADADGDGLTDAQEAKLGTDPLKKDTDGDGYNDGTEVATGHDPLK